MDKQTSDTLRKNLLGLMQLNGITSGNALSKKAGVSQKTVSNLLSLDDFSSPSIDILGKIANALGVSHWMLLIPNLPIAAITKLKKPLKGISEKGYKLLYVFEMLPEQDRNTLLEFAQYQLQKDYPLQAQIIQESRTALALITPEEED